MWMRNLQSRGLSPGHNHCTAVTQTPGFGNSHMNTAGYQHHCGDQSSSSLKYFFTELKSVIIKVEYDGISMESSYLENVMAVSACNYLSAVINNNPTLRKDHQCMVFDVPCTEKCLCFRVFLSQDCLDQL